ncbi:hypothetical protein AVEN_94127-1 [Araneus ventricosus]|uniref:Uncharacterized protein n=1 Tax=Araneus ventricosus TaxID=182803 RepID=A0A4Y2NZ13_ARAVE|nr:hypothetical protein AVEN_94127-1 [Araneus ventricosus]
MVSASGPKGSKLGLRSTVYVGLMHVISYGVGQTSSLWCGEEVWRKGVPTQTYVELFVHNSLTVSEVKNPKNVPYCNEIPVGDGKESFLLECFGEGIIATFLGYQRKRIDGRISQYSF